MGRRLAALLAAVAASAASAATVAAAPPPGATAQCRDGTYSYSQHHSGTCSYHGGVALWLNGSSTSAGGGGSSAGSCGVERWTVKTLQDRPNLLPTRTVTLRYLVTRPAPAYLPSTRLAFERHRFTVNAAVVLLRAEADSDIHVVLEVGSRTMIAEAPSPSCDPHAAPLYRREIAAARASVRRCSRARVTGVAFFDFKHGQAGVAPNGIELHPLLGFRCLG